MPKAATVTSYSLVVAAGLGGTTVPAPGVYGVPAGTVETITASPYPGYVFDHWEGDASGTDPVISVTVDQDTGVIAYFSSDGATTSHPTFTNIVLPILGIGVSILGIVVVAHQAAKSKKPK